MRYRYQSGNTIYDISIERQGEIYRANLDGQSYNLEILDSQPGQLDLLFAGQPISLYWARVELPRLRGVTGWLHSHLRKTCSSARLKARRSDYQ